LVHDVANDVRRSASARPLWNSCMSLGGGTWIWFISVCPVKNVYRMLLMRDVY